MKKNTKYNENVLNWPELETIGINREGLETKGQLRILLDGEITEPVSVRVTVLGEIQEMEVTLQLLEENEKIILQMTAVQPDQFIPEPEDNIQ